MTMNNPFEGKEIWFGVGSQDLYGEEALRQVAQQSTEIVDALNASGRIPVKLVLKPTLKSSDGVRRFMVDASADDNCIGVITWMHTFSPAKMWIRGLEALKKPLLQLNTQHHFEIPWDTIDMDFMNLNQAAHGDREYGYIVTRLGIPRKIVVGHYTDPAVADKIGVWARACAGWQASNTKYEIAPELLDKDYDSLLIAAREECAMVNMMRANNCTAGVDNFEDLGALPQLPGVGPQRFPSEYGWGFSAEGDWKTAVLVRIGAVMGYGLDGGASLMEDYSYNFTPGNEMIMGSHMLEVSPSVGTIAKPRLEIHPLGIGGKADPVRLVFTVAPKQDAVVVSLADVRTRFRMLMNVVDVVEPLGSLSKLPCARALWKPEPNLEVSAECWLRAGGSHHTCMTTSVGREAWEDFARIAGVELATIDAETTPREFERELELEDMVHELRNRH